MTFKNTNRVAEEEKDPLFGIVPAEFCSTHSIEVKPHDLQSVWHIQKALIRKLLRKFDLQCTPEHGHFVAVTSIESLGNGQVKEGTGAVTYPVCFRGITFKPLEAERAYAIVRKVSEERVLAMFGPECPVYVENWDEGMEGYSFDKEEKKYVHSDGSVISQGSVIRVEVTRVTWDEKTKMFATNATLKGRFLGIDQQPRKVSVEQKGKQPV